MEFVWAALIRKGEVERVKLHFLIGARTRTTEFCTWYLAGGATSSSPDRSARLGHLLAAILATGYQLSPYPLFSEV